MFNPERNRNGEGALDEKDLPAKKKKKKKEAWLLKPDEDPGGEGDYQAPTEKIKK